VIVQSEIGSFDIVEDIVEVVVDLLVFADDCKYSLDSEDIRNSVVRNNYY
jgi:hypothetical protein